MSDQIKPLYAWEHARMLKALTDDKAVVVYHRSGPTWNDGGAWHRIVARLSDGSHVSIKMESDYAPDVLVIEPLKQWPPKDDKDARIADLERQLDATLMELAETQALELQHGAVIERLTRQLAEVLESARAAVVAVEAEIDARHAYEDLPTDRGGRDGPKGKAYARWLDRRASVFAAIRALKGAAK